MGIAEDYLSLVVTDLGAIAYYPCDEDPVPTTNDAIDNAASAATTYDMTARGTPVGGFQGPAGNMKAIYFDGTEGFYERTGVPMLGTANVTAYTIAAWIKADDWTTGAQMIFTQRQAAAQSNANFNVTAGGELNHDEFPPSNLSLQTSGVGIGDYDTEWHLYVMVKDTGRREIWIDKTIVAQDTSPETYTGSTINQSSWMMRAYNNGLSFDLFTAGYMSSAGAWTTALTSSEIESLYDTVAGGGGGGGGKSLLAKRRSRSSPVGGTRGGGGARGSQGRSRWDRRRRRLT